jgi:oligopeptide transport system ATP-binding protein
MSSSGAAPLLTVEALHKTYGGRQSLAERLRGQPQPRLTALDGVSLRLYPNEVLGLVGESGSGKTTTARCIVRLEMPDSGSVVFDGRDVLSAKAASLRAIRRDIQMIFQDPYTSLNPRMTVAAAISEPALVHGLINTSQVDSFVRGLLDQVGLPQTAAGLRPRSLSGGQRQRVAIARTLALKPRVIIADEAVSALDVSIQAQILNLFADLIRQLNLSMIFISHQLSVIAQLSDRVAIMYMGRIVETGPTAAVFARPRHPYTSALIQAHPQVQVGKRSQPALIGEIPSPYAVPRGCRFNTRCAYAQSICYSDEPPHSEEERGHHTWCHVLPELSAHA